MSAATTVGRYVTIGQGCVLRSATVEDEVLIGEKCVLMEGCLVESHSILAPGTVLPPGRLVPSGQLWAGNPAKFVRDLTKDEVCLCLLKKTFSSRCQQTVCVIIAIDHHCIQQRKRTNVDLAKCVCGRSRNMSIPSSLSALQPLSQPLLLFIPAWKD